MTMTYQTPRPAPASPPPTAAVRCPNVVHDRASRRTCNTRCGDVECGAYYAFVCPRCNHRFEGYAPGGDTAA